MRATAITHEWGNSTARVSTGNALTGQQGACQLPETLNFPTLESYVDSIAKRWEFEAAAASALRILQRTQLNGDYNDYSKAPTPEPPKSMRAVNVRDYGNGLVELGYSGVQYIRRANPPEKESESLTVAEKEKRSAANHARSIRRSAAQVRRKCMAGGLDYLLTLTYRRNIQDVSLCYSHFKRFVRLVRERYSDWHYLAVHEYQQRGAVHFHLAVSGFQDVRYLRSCWLSAISAIGDGNVDVQAPKFKGSSKWKIAKLATYLSKYVLKDQGSAPARQRYRVSEGIEIPSSVFVYQFDKWTDFVAEIFDSLGVPVAHHWKDPSGPNGWACSWE